MLGNDARSIAFIFITSRQLLITRGIDNRFSPNGVVNKKMEKWLKMGIAFAVSRFDDNACRSFLRIDNADNNFRGLARWICWLHPAFVALVVRASSIAYEHLAKLRIPRIIVRHKYAKLGAAIYRKGHAWNRSFAKRNIRKQHTSDVSQKYSIPSQLFLILSYLCDN